MKFNLLIIINFLILNAIANNEDLNESDLNGECPVYTSAFNRSSIAFKNEKCLVSEVNKVNITSDLPVISLAIFAIKPVPFFEEFLQRITDLQYSKSKINIFIYCNTPFHDKLLEEFANNFGKSYKSFHSILSQIGIGERNGRRLAVEEAKRKNSAFLFTVDNDVHFVNPETLLDLLSHNHSFIAPVMFERDSYWSNFRVDYSEKSYYKSSEYGEIIEQNLLGIWKMPYVSSCYLASKTIFDYMNFEDQSYDPDIALSKSLQTSDISMNIVNVISYGHLINCDEFNTSLTVPDFYALLTNSFEWESRYLHPNYKEELLLPDDKHLLPCPDVYWFPIVSERFCDELVEIVETDGQWYDISYDNPNKNNDPYPTTDVRFYQVGLEDVWDKILKKFITPLQQKVYRYYFTPRGGENFVSRYKPDEQSHLKPHHDSSLYTVNIALNNAGVDYQGGGCRFDRYNCSVIDTKKGWMIMHPGQLTHMHEGLKTTNGTRYILVSFVRQTR